MENANAPRGTRRRERQRGEALRLLSGLDYSAIDSVIQCGLGDWAEGPVLLETFPNTPMLAVEPLQRYIFSAWAAGFRGPIIQAVLWNKTGNQVELQDFRTKTSLLDTERRWGSVPSTTITLDDAVKFTAFNSPSCLLWMDCEGAELTILEGAAETLKSTTAIVCELKDKPRLPQWPATPVVIDRLASLGFRFDRRVADDGLFLRA